MSIAVRMMRKLAQNNRLANQRLLSACLKLGPGEFEAARVSIFPSLKATLNHILTIDWFYVDALEGGTLGPRAWEPAEPFDAIGPLIAAQSAVDERLLAFVSGLTEAALRPRRASTAPAASSASAPTTCCCTCSCTRPTIAGRSTPCWPARQSSRRSSMSSSPAGWRIGRHGCRTCWRWAGAKTS